PSRVGLFSEPTCFGAASRLFLSSCLGLFGAPPRLRCLRLLRATSGFRLFFPSPRVGLVLQPTCFGAASLLVPSSCLGFLGASLSLGVFGPPPRLRRLRVTSGFRLFCPPSRVGLFLDPTCFGAASLFCPSSCLCLLGLSLCLCLFGLSPRLRRL